MFPPPPTPFAASNYSGEKMNSKITITFSSDYVYSDDERKSFEDEISNFIGEIDDDADVSSVQVEIEGAEHEAERKFTFEQWRELVSSNAGVDVRVDVKLDGMPGTITFRADNGYDCD